MKKEWKNEYKYQVESARAIEWNYLKRPVYAKTFKMAKEAAERRIKEAIEKVIFEVKITNEETKKTHNIVYKNGKIKEQK